MGLGSQDAGAGAPGARYEVMDALRGVAAAVVLFYHFGTRLDAPVSAPHGYLAVDFFFMLSGFVLSHAYAGRLAGLPLGRFVLMRAVRLLPMSGMGVAVGTAYLLLRWRAASHGAAASSDSLEQILGAGALNLALIPKLWNAGLTRDELFPADGVLWSLSLEFIINIAWAGGLARLGPRSQLALAAAGALVAAVFVIGAGEANLGWNWTTYAAGAGRALFGFLAGVLLWRFRPRVRVSRVWPLLVGAALILALCLPVTGWAYDLGVILLLFPVLIHLAAGTGLGAEGPAARFLGDLSYPLYALHMPILMGLSGALKLALHRDGPAPSWTYVLAAPIMLAAWGVGRWYEAPVRRWLGWRLQNASKREAHQRPRPESLLQ